MSKTTRKFDQETVPNSAQRGPSAGDTQPLQPVSNPFSALAEGALLPSQQPHYEISAVLNEGEKINVYQAQTLYPVRLCKNVECGHQTDQLICPDCNSPTFDPITFYYKIKESSEQNITFQSLELARQRQLAHPGLYIYHHFSDTPYGDQPRYYVLEPEPGPQLAENLAPPQEIWKVLDWGQQLAETLAYLHSKSLVWHVLNQRHLALDDKRAYWVNLNIRDAQSPADYQNDVRRLAEQLFYLVTGAKQYAYPTQFPAVVGNLFEQLLGQPTTTMNAGALAQALKSVAAELRRPVNGRLTAYAQTDVGRVRDHNEDSFMAQEMAWSNVGATYPLGLYVVADGMGGHSAGEVASGQVISHLSQKMAEDILRLRPDGAEFKAFAFEPGAWLQTTIQAANKTVFDQAKQTGNDMGTTLVAALVLGNVVHIAHVGDSRAYLLNQQIRPLTTDHSVVERLIATNQITREQARSHPQRNVIYRTIGDKANIEVEVNTHQLNPGDCLLLCSDGLNGMVTDEDLHRIYLNHQHDLAETCRQMITAANSAGGDDNVTAILVAYTTYESRA